MYRFIIVFLSMAIFSCERVPEKYVNEICMRNIKIGDSFEKVGAEFNDLTFSKYQDVIGQKIYTLWIYKDVETGNDIKFWVRDRKIKGISCYLEHVVKPNSVDRYSFSKKEQKEIISTFLLLATQFASCEKSNVCTVVRGEFPFPCWTAVTLKNKFRLIENYLDLTKNKHLGYSGINCRPLPNVMCIKNKCVVEDLTIIKH